MKTDPFYRQLLRNELSRRIERNRNYSLRAFAKAIQIDAAALSRILAGKKKLSPELTLQIVSALELSPELQFRFVSSVAESTTRAKRDRLERLSGFISKTSSAKPSAGNNLNGASDDRDHMSRELSTEVFRVISDWYHYAILELTFTESFQSQPRWIATRLGISVMEAKLAIERLKSLDLLAEEEGRLQKTDHHLKTADRHLSSPALRKRQRQVLERAIVSLEEDPIEKRDTTALCMAIDPLKIPEAKRRIQEFKNSLCAFLESGARTEVYELAISLFPQSQPVPIGSKTTQTKQGETRS